ncbi:hypothetical protein [Arthrobacter sp. efr-133-R2A-120]|uniref:hypothetical protein n=1 Tax=Arthrobacter sp. efr-133-R2A-120 TaxID=3040277 RepID=UPI002549CA84|nr:hypothetical protein [Arthrobacter sp. efr-133-R2A-120]
MSETTAFMSTIGQAWIAAMYAVNPGEATKFDTRRRVMLGCAGKLSAQRTPPSEDLPCDPR